MYSYYLVNLRNKVFLIKFYLKHFSNLSGKIKKCLTLNQNRNSFQATILFISTFVCKNFFPFHGNFMCYFFLEIYKKFPQSKILCIYSDACFFVIDLTKIIYYSLLNFKVQLSFNFLDNLLAVFAS